MQSRDPTTDAGGLPELPWREWGDTISTLHMWSQIVGKVRMALAPPVNHWWHVTLYVGGRGLTTSPIPYGRRQFAIDFDFVDHVLRVVESGGRSYELPLAPRSVASFYRELMAGLKGLDIDVSIQTRPVEVAEAIPFEADEQHASYDQGHATAFWRGLMHADRVMKAFQSGFLGKVSPVHFFWGGFDLASSRYSGRPAPQHPGGIANCPDWVMAEAYSREEFAFGWWPVDPVRGPLFYSYVYPEPEGMRSAQIRPPGASFDADLGEFVLPCEALRGIHDADAAVFEFLESTYGAGADLADWDRTDLEPSVRPTRPAVRPWSLADRPD